MTAIVASPFSEKRASASTRHPLPYRHVIFSIFPPGSVHTIHILLCSSLPIYFMRLSARLHFRHGKEAGKIASGKTNGNTIKARPWCGRSTVVRGRPSGPLWNFIEFHQYRIVEGHQISAQYRCLHENWTRTEFLHVQKKDGSNRE